MAKYSKITEISISWHLKPFDSPAMIVRVPQTITKIYYEITLCKMPDKTRKRTFLFNTN